VTFLGMTISLAHSHPVPKYELSSRPKRSEVEGPAVLSTSHRMDMEAPALPFVIPSEAEGSAVLQARPGNVFRGGGLGLESLRENQEFNNSVPQGRLSVAQDVSPGLGKERCIVP
jgi:hypothetical protein